MKKIFLVVLFSVSLIFATEKAVKLSISGMCCKDCSEKIEAKLKEVSGVKSADVSFESSIAEVKISDNAKVDNKNLISAVLKAGDKYKVEVVGENSKSADSKKECKGDCDKSKKAGTDKCDEEKHGSKDKADLKTKGSCCKEKSKKKV